MSFQDEATEQQSKNGNPMFGDSFPKSRTPNDFGYRFGYRRQFALFSVSYAKLQVGRGLAGSLITLDYAYLS